MEIGKTRKIGMMVGAACATAMLAVCAMTAFPAHQAHAATPPTAFAKIGNYSTEGSFVQGGTVSSNGSTAYVVKQKRGSYVNLQKIDMRTKKPTRLALSSAGKKAIGHGNGLAYAKVKGKDYLLVAPGHGAHYVSVFNVSGNKANYKGKVTISTSVVSVAQKIAVEKVSGNKVTALIGKGSTLKRITLDISKRSKVKFGTSIKGFWSSCNQGIAVGYQNGVEYVYGVRNGWETEYGEVVKFRLSGKTLKKQWTGKIAGEPQTAAPVNGKLYVFVEGASHWNKVHHCRFSDRIVQWNA